MNPKQSLFSFELSRRRALGLFAASLGAAGAVAAQSSAEAAPLKHATGSDKTVFPRLALISIGNPHNYHDAEYQKKIAKFDFALLGMYNGWHGGAAAMALAVSQIRALNPHMLLANYTNFTEVYSGPNPATQYRHDKLDQEVGPNGVGDWWAYNAAGEHVNWSAGVYPVWEINITDFTTPDAHGERWPEWSASKDYELLIGPPGFDMWFVDNNFWRPRSLIDWNRDGLNDSPDNIDVRNWVRNGYRAYYQRAKELAPESLVMVNADSDLSGDVYPPGADEFDQYKGLIDGALMEHAIGKSWSAETWRGWSAMMGWYHQLSRNLIDPRLAVLDAYLADPSDYQTLRYALGSTLLGDGYFSGSTNYNAANWYDEFDLAGAASPGWLGAALEEAVSPPWTMRVYRRVFENGLVLVNPKGNGPQTVKVPGGYSRIQGVQDPVVNNGRQVTEVTLADRDALLLVRTSYARKLAGQSEQVTAEEG